MYSTKDKILDAIACTFAAGAFLLLYSAACIMDLTITGM